MIVVNWQWLPAPIFQQVLEPHNCKSACNTVLENVFLCVQWSSSTLSHLTLTLPKIHQVFWKTSKLVVGIVTEKFLQRLFLDRTSSHLTRHACECTSKTHCHTALRSKAFWADSEYFTEIYWVENKVNLRERFDQRLWSQGFLHNFASFCATWFEEWSSACCP